MTSFQDQRDFQAPLNLPPTADDAIDRLTAQIKQLRYGADRVMDSPVTGPRGQQLTVAEAQHRAKRLSAAIDAEEAAPYLSQRHRRVPRLARTLVLLIVADTDFPIMLWFAGSVFNVDWQNPLQMPLALSVAVAVLTTGGAATALHHLGHDQRQNKNHRRHLDRAALTNGSKISLLGVALLVTLIALVAFFRVWTEGMLSGLDSLALLLAALVALVMLISAWLIFWTAFRDGSPEQEDLACYTRLVQEHLGRKREFERRATQLQHDIEVIARRAYRNGSHPCSASAPPSGKYTVHERALRREAISPADSDRIRHTG